MASVLKEVRQLGRVVEVGRLYGCYICRQQQQAEGSTTFKRPLHTLVRNTLRTYATKTSKMVKEDQIKQTVFDYVGKNARRADRVYVWGYAATGALGVRRFMKPEKKGQYVRKEQFIPHRFDFWDNYNLKVHGVGCGYGFTVYLCHDSKCHLLYGTGINTDSQLGYQEYPIKSGRILDYVVEPVPIQLPLLYPDTTKLQGVACGRAHTVVFTDNEGVFSLGSNCYGQCGRPIVEGETFRGSQIINKVPFTEHLVQVECGQDHSLFLTESGEVYSCGLGSDGQTGLGHMDVVSEPTRVEGDLVGEKIVQVSSKTDCVLAVSASGDVFGWGNNEYNQLAIITTDTMQLATPRHLPYKDVGKVLKVAAAGSTCALLNDQGDVYVWGYGILGKGPNVDESQTPTLLPPTLFGRNELNPDAKVIDIQCGINHFAAITAQGDLYVWGRNDTACLGLGHLKNQYFPFKVLVPAEVRHVECGVDHTVTLCKGFA